MFEFFKRKRSKASKTDSYHAILSSCESVIYDMEHNRVTYNRTGEQKAVNDGNLKIKIDRVTNCPTLIIHAPNGALLGVCHIFATAIDAYENAFEQSGMNRLFTPMNLAEEPFRESTVNAYVYCPTEDFSDEIKKLLTKKLQHQGAELAKFESIDQLPSENGCDYVTVEVARNTFKITRHDKNGEISSQDQTLSERDCVQLTKLIDENDTTALTRELEQGHTVISESLNSTVLMYACEMRKTDMVKTILDIKPDLINEQDNEGNTAVAYVFEYSPERNNDDEYDNLVELLTLLGDKNADWSIRNNNGMEMDEYLYRAGMTNLDVSRIVSNRLTHSP